jgi:hypothetical protein
LDRSRCFSGAFDRAAQQTQSFARLTVDWKAKQNSDGGWSYGRVSPRPGPQPGLSWTEPTALVLLAQAVTGINSENFANGMKFIHSMEGGDGGFRPHSGVLESTWVTAFAALLPERALGAERYGRAVEWLKGQTGRESGWRYRLQQRLSGSPANFPKGWPWFPGAAAWVIPTALGVLAFERALLHGKDTELSERVRAGREYLFARMCADGGWNHGSNQALGIDGESYPETTGIALLALNGKSFGEPPRAVLARAKAAARKHLETCQTAEGIAWLRMGLAAHGESVSPARFQPVCRTNTDEALMALAAAERNPLLTAE